MSEWVAGGLKFRTVDERHVSRGYDPYNSADRLWIAYLVNERNVRIDNAMKRGTKQPFEPDYEFFPGTAGRRELFTDER